MCASERFQRRFSSIDYEAKGDCCAGEFRGEISETLTPPAFRRQRGRKQSRLINRSLCLSLLRNAAKKFAALLGGESFEVFSAELKRAMDGRIATRLLLGPIGSQKLQLVCEEI
jgi:hypothetical protein